MKLTRTVNRYQTDAVNFHSFPDEIDVKQLRYYGHLQGERVNRLKGVTIWDFTDIEWLKKSCNSKNEIEFVHCVGRVGNSIGLTALVLRIE